MAIYEYFCDAALLHEDFVVEVTASNTVTNSQYHIVSGNIEGNNEPQTSLHCACYLHCARLRVYSVPQIQEHAYRAYFNKCKQGSVFILLPIICYMVELEIKKTCKCGIIKFPHFDIYIYIFMYIHDSTYI